MKDAARRGMYLQEETGYFSLPTDRIQLLKLEFFKNLLQAYIDSYLVVMYAIYGIMENGTVIEQQKLVNGLHVGIQEIYYKNGITFMNSCLFEILNTAFGRFSELGICTSQAYASQNSGMVIYLQCPTSNRQKVEKYLQILTDLSSARQKNNRGL